MGYGALRAWGAVSSRYGFMRRRQTNISRAEAGLDMAASGSFSASLSSTSLKTLYLAVQVAGWTEKAILVVTIGIYFQ